MKKGEGHLDFILCAGEVKVFYFEMVGGAQIRGRRVLYVFNTSVRIASTTLTAKENKCMKIQ